MRFLFVSSPIYSLIFPLIKFRSSNTLIIAQHFCYFHHGPLSSHIMTFMSHLINYNFYPCSSTTFRVHKFMISQFHLQNTTMALGEHMRPLQLHVLYTLGTGALQLTPRSFKSKTDVKTGSEWTFRFIGIGGTPSL